MGIRKRDLEIERLRRSGPGGQHRNRRATGVRITHRPTGIVVMATERRSQRQNLDAALERLAEKLRRRSQPKKRRIKTKPSRAAKEKRKQSKKRRALTKKLRRRPRIDD